MTPNRILLELLKGGLHTDYIPHIETASPEDWETAFQLAETNTILGLTFWGASKLQAKQRPPQPLYTRWLAKTTQINALNKRIDRTATAIFRQFDEQNLNVVIMKGQAVARYYPKPELRQPGDIDIYSDEDNYPRVEKILTALSQDQREREKYLTIKFGGVTLNNYHGLHFKFVVSGVLVESHGVMFSHISPKHQKEFDHLLSLWYPNHIRRINLSEGSVRTLPIWFDCIFILAHLFRHFIQEGVGLRQVSDWLMVARQIAHAPDLDREQLARNLDSVGLLPMARLLCGFAIHYMAFPPQDMPLEPLDNDKMERQVVYDIITGGNWGKQRIHRPEGNIRGSWYFFRYFCERCKRYRSLSPDELSHPVLYKLKQKFLMPLVFKKTKF